MIDTVLIAVPARDEQQRLAACLRSLRAAVHSARCRWPALEVSIGLAADMCTDATAGVPTMTGFPEVSVAVVTDGSPGLARNAAVAAAVRGCELSRSPSRSSETTWIATTDADSTVPVDWLVDHLQCANAGASVVVGRVVPDPADTNPGRLARWHRRHRFDEGHGHIFGANLGIRLDVFQQLGGFDAPTGEDVRLVARARAAGYPVAASVGAAVLTSGREQARVSDGFGGYLRGLADRPPA